MQIFDTVSSTYQNNLWKMKTATHKKYWFFRLLSAYLTAHTAHMHTMWLQRPLQQASSIPFMLPTCNIKTCLLEQPPSDYSCVPLLGSPPKPAPDKKFVCLKTLKFCSQTTFTRNAISWQFAVMEKVCLLYCAMIMPKSQNPCVVENREQHFTTCWWTMSWVQPHPLETWCCTLFLWPSIFFCKQHVQHGSLSCGVHLLNFATDEHACLHGY